MRRREVGDARNDMGMHGGFLGPPMRVLVGLATGWAALGMTWMFVTIDDALA